MTRSATIPAVVPILLVFLFAGCAGGGKKPPQPAAVQVKAPRWDELRGATFHGIAESKQPVTLRDGRWEGPPSAPGGASRPSLELVGDFRLFADLDGDGASEAVVLLAGNSGGTGTNNYLAVVDRKGAGLENLATTLVGDRVELRAARIEGRRILLDLVQAGESDAMCCPGELVTRTFELSGEELTEPVVATSTGRLALATIADREWVLLAWDIGEPAPKTPVVTLALKEGRITGNAGCNGYFATATAGDQPGAIVLGAAGSTKKLCPPSVMQVEERYLPQLSRVTRYGFLAGRLALTYRTDGGVGTMLFEEKR